MILSVCIDTSMSYINIIVLPTHAICKTYIRYMYIPGSYLLYPTCMFFLCCALMVLTIIQFPFTLLLVFLALYGQRPMATASSGRVSRATRETGSRT